jgi:death-on-curing protein
VRSLSYQTIVTLHERLIERHGGSFGIRDDGALRAAIDQPFVGFAGQDLYPTVEDKAAALAHALIANHPFVDGNKRVGHAALEISLRINGIAIRASNEEREAFILATAAGEVSRDAFREWVRERAAPLSP